MIVCCIIPFTFLSFRSTESQKRCHKTKPEIASGVADTV